MNAHRIEALLVEEILAACPELGHVPATASLTGDLGLDSLTLTSLFATVKTRFGHLSLAPWFIAASNSGTDTIGSLAAFIAERVTLDVAA